ncbi:MAG TPA: DNA polymerase III subunit delta [Ktedonobacterales bacterium]
MFYLFHGPDDFSAGEALNKLREAGPFTHNVDTFDGETADVATIRNACETLPFLADQRLIIVRGLPQRKRGAAVTGADAPAAEPAPTVKGRKRAGNDPKAFVAALAAAAESLPETTVLVVLIPEKLESGDPLVKVARAQGKEQFFDAPKGPALEDWLVRRAKADGTTLTRQAAELLVTLMGDDTRALAGEVDKLRTYVGPGGSITPEHVRLLTARSASARTFDLTDALARGQRSRAIALLHELLEQGESPLGILALTAYQTRVLMQVKDLAGQGLRTMAICQQAGLAPFVVDKSLAIARQLTMEQLAATHHRLLEMDTALKRSRMNPEMALDLLMFEFGRTA